MALMTYEEAADACASLTVPDGMDVACDMHWHYDNGTQRVTRAIYAVYKDDIREFPIFWAVTPDEAEIDGFDNIRLIHTGSFEG